MSLKTFDFLKAWSLIERYRPVLEYASLAIYEDYDATSYMVYHCDSGYSDDDEINPHGSNWGTPCVVLFFKNKTVSTVNCFSGSNAGPSEEWMREGHSISFKRFGLLVDEDVTLLNPSDYFLFRGFAYHKDRIVEDALKHHFAPNVLKQYLELEEDSPWRYIISSLISGKSKRLPGWIRS